MENSWSIYIRYVYVAVCTRTPLHILDFAGRSCARAFDRRGVSYWYHPHRRAYYAYLNSIWWRGIIITPTRWKKHSTDYSNHTTLGSESRWRISWYVLYISFFLYILVFFFFPPFPHLSIISRREMYQFVKTTHLHRSQCRNQIPQKACSRYHRSYAGLGTCGRE